METGEVVRRRIEGVDTPTTAVVTAIADVRGVETAAVKPLHDSVDPDALNGLFEPTSLRSREGTAAFDHDGCRVELAYGDRATAEVVARIAGLNPLRFRRSWRSECACVAGIGTR